MEALTRIVIRARRSEPNFPVPADATHLIETVCEGAHPRRSDSVWQYDIAQHRNIREARIYANGVASGAMRFQNALAKVELSPELVDIDHS
jgi:hypothetical protein